MQLRFKGAGKMQGRIPLHSKIKEILSKLTSVTLRISAIVALFELMNLGTQAGLFAGDKNWEMVLK